MATATCVQAALKEDNTLFSEAVGIACSVLQVESLYDDQYEALHQFFSGKDRFFSAHTGYGKSLIFQAIPIIYDVLNKQTIGTPATATKILPAGIVLLHELQDAFIRFLLFPALQICCGCDDCFALKMDSISTFVKATDRGGGDLDDGVLFSAGGSSCSSTPAKMFFSSLLVKNTCCKGSLFSGT